MTKEEIHRICKIFEIKNYTINPDTSIDVNGDVELGTLNLNKIPLNFNNVSGYFNISYNNITSLEGCPKYIGGIFYCNNNKLTSLEGCPKEVGGGFYCYYNQLTSLEGCPNEVGGDFYCSNNQLTNLEGSPNYIGGYFTCYNNKLTSLNHFPNKVVYDIMLKSNPLESLAGYNGDYDKLYCDNKDGLILKLKRKQKLKILEKL